MIRFLLSRLVFLALTSWQLDIFVSTQDRRKLLQQWVSSNQDPGAIEADLVFSRNSSHQQRGTRELLTAAQMLKREMPLEKVRAIVARGHGVPDPDCPEVASLTRFWVCTSTVMIDKEETKQEQTVRVRGDASNAIESVLPTAGIGGFSSTLGADSMQTILQQLSTSQGQVYTYKTCPPSYFSV